MKEYSILQRHGSARPFIIHNFDNISSAMQKLYEIIQLEEDRGRPYFVDNDFFVNKYSNVQNLYYLQIIVREVSKWEKYSEEEEKQEDIKNNKIIFLENYKKVLTK